MSKMNVLVYSGPGTTKFCVEQCLNTFKLLLYPFYSVSTASEKMLKDQPWESKTAVLVIPGGADLPICKLFKGEINDRIKRFVNKGGKFIGICSGGYYSSSRCEFEVGNKEMEVSGSRDLGFFPGICRGSVVKGFQYGTEKGTAATRIKVNSKLLPDAPEYVHLYTNGGGVFVDAQKYTNVDILATYDDEIDVKDETEGVKASSVLCSVGRGKALLFGTHPEFDPHLLNEDSDVPKFASILKTLRSTNKERIEFLRAAVKTLGLEVNEKEYERPILTPLYLCSVYPNSAVQLVEKMESVIGYQIENIMDVGSEKFEVLKSLSIPSTTHKINQDPELAIKQLVLCQHELPPKEYTPFFDLHAFKTNLIEAYKETNQNLTESSIGNTFIYGEVLTSTSVLMYSNFNLLQVLPSGFTITGTIQVAGKGRSGNNWVNPKGVLAVSTHHLIPITNSEISPIVFVQYLSAMAFTKAVLNYDIGYNEIPLKIKWPNDIYIMLPSFIGSKTTGDSKQVTHVKVGGILVNTNVVGKDYCLTVGSGLNLSNEAPTTSVNLVIDAMNKYNESIGNNKHLEAIKEEKLLAKYLAIYNEMFEKFKVNGFRPFLQDYYSMWFHSNQIVTLDGDKHAQICGITPDWGLLMAKDLKTGEMYQLQPDGNSFDMFNGLIFQKR
ncbi:hypothetical protein CANINC_002721 [Pichia inconspicua]|uniref:BPL/LPL catalytic domain-containing protein n=1 Tax=Pichia inconspicua TaxID=52247 RepID=A0A4T0X0J4_9ASCO|nr:hypothetical protein CANINC_002721 [[Candida] inconspicua]